MGNVSDKIADNIQTRIFYLFPKIMPFMK